MFKCFKSWHVVVASIVLPLWTIAAMMLYNLLATHTQVALRQERSDLRSDPRIQSAMWGTFCRYNPYLFQEYAESEAGRRLRGPDLFGRMRERCLKDAFTFAFDHERPIRNRWSYEANGIRYDIWEVLVYESGETRFTSSRDFMTVQRLNPK